MVEFRFTGNPFVDAGLAGMCAAGGISDLQELTQERIIYAVDRLLRIITSPQSLEPGLKDGNNKPSTFASSELSSIFPNSPLVNPAIKLEDKPQRYKTDIAALLKSTLEGEASKDYCFACGRPANFLAQKSNFPLIDSADRANFHPSMHQGHPICAKCALAVQFLPFSIMTTGNDVVLWILSTLDSRISIGVAKKHSLQKMETCESQKKRLSFYGDWATTGRYCAVVASLCSLAENKIADLNTQFPVRALFFSNDNRGSRYKEIDIPHPALCFFKDLWLRPHIAIRFRNEVCKDNGQCGKILASEAILKKCIYHNDKDEKWYLFGGWSAHKLYAMEVLNVSTLYISTVESVAQRIADTEEPERLIKQFKVSRQNSFTQHHSLIKDKLMSKDEFYTLVPPNNFKAADSALDYISAATIDILYSRDNNEYFEKEKTPPIPVEEIHPIILLVESVVNNGTTTDAVLKRIYDNLKTARSVDNIRRVWLRAIEQHQISWVQFKQLVPPEEKNKTYVIRDYMLACLIDRLRDEIELPEDDELESDTNIEEYEYVEEN